MHNSDSESKLWYVYSFGWLIVYKCNLYYFLSLSTTAMTIPHCLIHTYVNICIDWVFPSTLEWMILLLIILSLASWSQNNCCFLSDYFLRFSSMNIKVRLCSILVNFGGVYDNEINTLKKMFSFSSFSVSQDARNSWRFCNMSCIWCGWNYSCTIRTSVHEGGGWIGCDLSNTLATMPQMTLVM